MITDQPASEPSGTDGDDKEPSRREGDSPAADASGAADPGQPPSETTPAGEAAEGDSTDAGGLSEDDLRFAKLVRQSQLVSSARIDDCVTTIEKIAELGARKTLQELMVEKGLLTETQAEAIAYAARKGEQGGILGGFQLLEKVGSGGMGEVYKARQISLDRVVALKILPERVASDGDFVARFLREAKTAAKLSHPNIVGAVDAGKTAGKYYFAMEYVDGQSLTQILETGGRVEEGRALEIIIQVTRALEYAWQHSMVHRDIKPDNIMITSHGDVKLADLGLAREAGDLEVTRVTQVGEMVGTPHYVSPEQAAGEEEVDIRSDIYALGVTFYQMVTGELPFKGPDAVSIVTARFHSSPVPANEVNPAVSHDVAQVINVMMALKPENRYPNPRVLLHDLLLVTAGHRPEFASPDKSARQRALEATETTPTEATLFLRRRGWGISKGIWISGAVVIAFGVLVNVGTHLAFRYYGPPEYNGAPPAQVTRIEEEAEATRKMVEAAKVEKQREDEARRRGEDARRKEEEARLARLEDEARQHYEASKNLIDKGRFEDALRLLVSVGSRFDDTKYDARLEGLKLEAIRRAEGAKRRAAEEAAIERNYNEMTALAREQLEIGDYGAALSILVRARGLKDTEEVRDLMDEARRIQNIARARDAEEKGRLRTAVDLYLQALEGADDPELRQHANELKRRVDFADAIARAESLAKDRKWQEANEAYTRALELADADAKADIQNRLKDIDDAIAYEDAISEGLAALKKEAWKEAVSHAEAALALRPGDETARLLVEQAGERLGPPKEVTNSMGMQFVLIPAGEFVMGSDAAERDERPAHKVYVDAYYISRCEVTNAQFEQYSVGHRNAGKACSPDDNMPAVGVTWDEAAAFCRWLSGKEGVEYRLPTEAEWERAARGGAARLYPWGDEAPAADGHYRCNFAPNRSQRLWDADGFTFAAPAGSYADGASAFGCSDLAGNVWEWCMDWYAPYKASQAETPRNPSGPDTGRTRVLRGGSYSDGADSLRCTKRFSMSPRAREYNVGFRCVRTVAGDGSTVSTPR